MPHARPFDFDRDAAQEKENESGGAPPVLAADESREKVWLDYKRSANGPYRC